MRYLCLRSFRFVFNFSFISLWLIKNVRLLVFVLSHCRTKACFQSSGGRRTESPIMFSLLAWSWVVGISIFWISGSVIFWSRDFRRRISVWWNWCPPQSLRLRQSWLNDLKQPLLNFVKTSHRILVVLERGSQDVDHLSTKKKGTTTMTTNKMKHFDELTQVNLSKDNNR